MRRVAAVRAGSKIVEDLSSSLLDDTCGPDRGLTPVVICFFFHNSSRSLVRVREVRASLYGRSAQYRVAGRHAMKNEPGSVCLLVDSCEVQLRGLWRARWVLGRGEIGMGVLVIGQAAPGPVTRHCSRRARLMSSSFSPCGMVIGRPSVTLPTSRVHSVVGHRRHR